MRIMVLETSAMYSIWPVCVLMAAIELGFTVRCDWDSQPGYQIFTVDAKEAPDGYEISRRLQERTQAVFDRLVKGGAVPVQLPRAEPKRSERTVESEPLALVAGGEK